MQVVGVSAWPRNRTVLYTAAGWRVVVTPGQLALEGPPGVAADEEAALPLGGGAGTASGRRLLQYINCSLSPEDALANWCANLFLLDDECWKSLMDTAYPEYYEQCGGVQSNPNP